MFVVHSCSEPKSKIILTMLIFRMAKTIKQTYDRDLNVLGSAILCSLAYLLLQS